MVNLIGEEVTAVLSGEGCQAIYSIPGAVVHLYGKRLIRPRRKMGHVTFTAPEADTAVSLAQQFTARIKRPTPPIPSHHT
jgi:5-(carboxyamino)imidazole ribonucleotide synthase